MERQIKFYGLVRKLGNSHIVTIPKSLLESDLVKPGLTYKFGIIEEDTNDGQ